jgi:hypothetical protein
MVNNTFLSVNPCILYKNTVYNASLRTFGLYRRDKAQGTKPTAYRATLHPCGVSRKGIN